MKINNDYNSPAISANAQHSQPIHDPKKVAQEFESLFTAIMLRSMRNTVNRSELIPESLGEKMYTEMLDDEYAKIISDQGSFGLADLILKEIEKNEENDSGLSTLRGLNRSPWMMDPRLIPNSAPADATYAGRSIDTYASIVHEASEKYGVDSSLIRAVIAQESAGNPNAISKAGAKGLMQLMDTTANDMGVRRVFDPRENILGGTRYLKEMLERFGGDERLALAAYNAGPSAVDKYQGIPPYPETQNYVGAVLRLQEQFAEK